MPGVRAQQMGAIAVALRVAARGCGSARHTYAAEHGRNPSPAPLESVTCRTGPAIPFRISLRSELAHDRMATTDGLVDKTNDHVIPLAVNAITV